MTRATRETRAKAVRPRLTDQQRYYRSVPESDVLRAVLDYAFRLGGYGFRLNSGAVRSTYNGKDRVIRYGEPGASDTILIINGKVLFVECKTETGQQSPEQINWQNQIESAGGVYLLVRPSDWQSVIDGALL